MEHINTEAAFIRTGPIRTMSQVRKWCEVHFFSYSIYIEKDGSLSVYVPKEDYAKAMTDYLKAQRDSLFFDGVDIKIKKMTFWSLFKVYFKVGLR
jgi:hypothetical protein